MADTTKTILDVKSGDQGPVVWQAQMSADDVFVAPNKRPGGWCNTPTLQNLFAKKPIALKLTAKAALPAVPALPRLAAKTSQPTGVTAVGGVVTDQSGRWLRYERLMNLPEYKAITSNSWYRLKKLNSISSLTLPTGSIEFKSAWKILTPAEVAGGRYYTTSATVYNTPDGAKSPGPNPVTLGLVGLHIINKTPTRSGFFWSTFEQVDNDSVFSNTNSKTTPEQGQEPVDRLLRLSPQYDREERQDEHRPQLPVSGGEVKIACRGRSGHLIAGKFDVDESCRQIGDDRYEVQTRPGRRHHRVYRG
jgi:hypothetical protein